MMNGVTIKKYKAMKDKADRAALRLFFDPTQRNWMKFQDACDALDKVYPSPVAEVKAMSAQVVGQL
jgi:hypothetical protein